MNIDRLVIEAQQSYEEGATFVRHDGGIRISVAEEHAVDSYNQSFTCSITMSRQQVRKLHKWLTKILEEGSDP